MKDTNENKIEKESNVDKINSDTNFGKSLGHIFLLVIVILICGNALLIYYMINTKEFDMQNQISTVEKNEVIENDVQTDTIANIITSTVFNSTSSNTTISSKDVDNRKVLNENLIVLYNGLILDTEKMEQVELKYIDSTSSEKDKYVITYNNYENFAKKDSTLGSLSTQQYNGLLKIENVSKIAISENYNAMPREIKVVNTIPQIILDNNSKMEDFDSTKVIISDLDGNGTEEYVAILANRKTGYSKISVYNDIGIFVDDLVYIEKSKWNLNSNEEYYLGLENVNIIDVDNDGIMEILVEIPKLTSDPSVSILKYRNNILTGKKNIECSLLE